MDFGDKTVIDARSSFLGSHPHEAEQEVSLLIELIAGKLAFDDDLEDQDGSFVENLLNDAYENLDFLPPHAPEWQSAVPEFVERVTALMGVKEQKRNQAATLDSEFAAIREQYAELIQFFQWNANRWATANLRHPGQLPLAHERAVELKEMLSRYAPLSTKGLRPPRRNSTGQGCEVK